MKDKLYIFLHLHRSGGTTINKHLHENLIPEVEFIHLGSPWLTEKEKKIKKIIRFEKRPLSLRKKAKVISGHLAYYGIHKLVPEKEPHYFTFLRDPADRLVSFYNSRDWGSSKKPTFEEWYKTRRKNEMVHFYSSKFLGNDETAKIPKIFRKLSSFGNIEKIIFNSKKILNKLGYFKFKNNQKEEFENAKKLIDSCWYIGIVEDSEKDIRFLFKKMGLPLRWKNFNVGGNENPLKKNKLNRTGDFKLSSDLRKKIYSENPLDIKLYNHAKKLNKNFRNKFEIK